MPAIRSSRTRANLARLFAVLALVAAVAMMQGAPCRTELAWTAQCPTSSTQVVAHSDQVDDTGWLDAVLLAGAFLVAAFAVLIGFAVLRRDGAFRVPLVPLPVWSSPSRRLEVRLAQLCVLRA